MKRRPDTKIGRLALRHEGANWNAYYALPGTMDGAIFLGSIAMRFVVGQPERSKVFMDLMREAVSDLIEELTGQRPTWPEGVQPAPEHERAGMAKDIDNREALQMMARCKEEIQTLRAQIEHLKPKADAYDNLAIVLNLLPRQSVGMGEDLVWVLDKRMRELAEVSSSNPARSASSDS